MNNLNSTTLWAYSLALILTGCAGSNVAPALTDHDVAQARAKPLLVSQTPGSPNGTDVVRLRALWQQRATSKPAGDYPIGPGDIIEISVPAMEELRAQTVRVTSDGSITLPFIGKLTAGGLTEEELRGAIAAQLLKYMHEPKVISYVKEHKNRQVAVLGSVLKPGVYNLRGEEDTILDLLSQAGGIAPGADPRIHLIPAEPADKNALRQFAGTLALPTVEGNPSPLLMKKTEPIVIDLQELAYGGFQEYLSLHVRPGDVGLVPGGGQILVDGWVTKPGAYSVSPGLTVAGVVAAAGGALYPADTSIVKIIRTERNGKKNIFYSDLEKIKNGAESDVVLQGGDFIELTAATGKLVPYALYRFFTTVLNVGVGANIPIR